MKQVSWLKQAESVRLDSDRLAELYNELGVPGAEDVVCRALEEMAARLSRIERRYHEGNHGEMRKTARSLAAICEPVGMHLLSRVASDVTRCIDAGDATALAATLARLLRVGERSLTEAWEMQDISI